MNRWLPACIVFGAAWPAAAQWSLDSTDRALVLRNTWKNVITTEVTADYNANTVNNELPIALWKGSFLEDDLRSRSRDALRERNSLGYIVEGRVTWSGALRGRWRTVASLAHHEQMGTRFTRDLFSVTFFGNAIYERRRADLGPSAATAIRYQTIGIGQQDQRSNSYWRLDYVLGNSYEAVDVTWAGMFTGIDGRVIRSSVLGEHFRSDTSTTGGFPQVDGMGAAFSGRWETKLGRSSRNVRFALEVQDLGFANWIGQTLRVDTTIEYRGFEVPSILDLDNVIIGESQVLDTFGLTYTSGNATKPLPFCVRALVRAPLSPNWQGSVSLDQRYLPGYVPQLVFGAERRLGTRTDASATLSMGGFGVLRVGAAVQHLLNERWLLRIGSTQLAGFFLGTARGAGVSFAVACGF